MKLKIQLILLFSFIGFSSYSQVKIDSEYTGIEYVQLKSDIAKGWNTWNTNSVLSHVLLPEAISVNFYLKDNSSGETLKNALIGKRGKESESVLPLAHSFDGSYTELIINWNNIKLKIQSTADNKNISFLLSPEDKNEEGQVLISPQKIWWDRDGKITIGENQILFDLPSGTINLFAQGKPGEQGNSDGSYLAFSAAAEIALSTEEELSVSAIRQKIIDAKAVYEQNKSKYGNNHEVYNAMQNSLAWNMIYDPEGYRELTTVNRLWNTYRGGFVIFCWDNYFAAYMHSLDNKALAYANAIEITNSITGSGFIPNLSASKGIKSSDRSQPPVGSFVVREIYRQYKEKWFLHETFQKLLTWNRWWENNRDTDGFLCWGSSPFEPYLRDLDKNAHTRYGAALESGLDNSPMYDDIPFDPIRNQLKLADVGLMSLYIMDCEALSDIAGELGKEDIKSELLNRAEKYRKNLKKLWSEKEGIYLNKRLDTNEFSYSISPTNFYPLLAKAPSQKQAERMINEHFYNPEEFWGDYIMPSIAFNDPGYISDDYWRGRIWGPMNFLVYLGFRNYNLKDAQEDLVKKSKELLLEQWLQNGYVCENYNSQTGECDDVNRCEVFYHWGGLLGFISLIEEGHVPDPNQIFF
jgi:hypothetical protein